MNVTADPVEAEHVAPEAPGGEEGARRRAVQSYGCKVFVSNFVVFLILFFVGERAFVDDNYVLGSVSMLLALTLVPILTASCGSQLPKRLLFLGFVAYPGIIALSTNNDIFRAVTASFGPFGRQTQGLLPYVLIAVVYVAFFFGLFYLRVFIILYSMSTTVTGQGLRHFAPLSPEEGAAGWADLAAPTPVRILCPMSIKGSLRIALMLAFSQILMVFLYFAVSSPLLDHNLKFPYGMLAAFLLVWPLPAFRSWTIIKNWPRDFTIDQRQRLLLVAAVFRLTFYAVLLSFVGGVFRAISLQTGYGDCRDFDPDCPQWAEEGHCKPDSPTQADMELICALSCELCHPGMWPLWADLLWLSLFLFTLPALRFTYSFAKASRRLYLSSYGVNESFAQQLVAQGTQLHELDERLASLAMERSGAEAAAAACERSEPAPASAASSSNP